jgi:LPXTG-motif cell wall-anchored protein
VYRAIGQEAAACLGQSWMQIADACDHPDSAAPELRPTKAMCAPYYDSAARTKWDAAPLCPDLKATPASVCADKEWLEEAVEDLADCLNDPLGRAACAVALHPGTIADLSAACPGIYTTAIERARQKRSTQIALWVGGAALVIGAGVYFTRKRK